MLLKRASARLDFCNKTPIKTKRGTATKAEFVMSPYNLLGIAPRKAGLKVSVKTPIPAKIIAVPAKENATGNPANKTRQTTINIINGINSAMFYLYKGFYYLGKALHYKKNAKGQ
tara:strand:+ start:87 stop:431 length:345 start_codon:yes stop_codon:yes gene_type:complete